MDALPVYTMDNLQEAEFQAARLELATDRDYAVTVIGPSLFRVAPSRVVSAGSAAIDAFKEN